MKDLFITDADGDMLRVETPDSSTFAAILYTSEERPPAIGLTANDAINLAESLLRRARKARKARKARAQPVQHACTP